ncbi:MAG: hypothetical protein RLZZ536_1909 [Planctomycetota bacterium]
MIAAALAAGMRLSRSFALPAMRRARKPRPLGVPLPWTTTPTCLSRTLATPPLCCAAQPMTTIDNNQNFARKKKAASSPWRLRQRLGTATLVTSNLLFLAAANVLFPIFTKSAHVIPGWWPSH